MNAIDKQIVACNFDRPDDALGWIRACRSVLREPLRPTHFGEHEKAARTPDNLITNESAFERCLERASLGFFLFGPKLSVNISLKAQAGSTISWYFHRNAFRFPETAIEVVLSLAKFGANFGRACMWSEYAWRNRYTIRYVNGGTAEAFIGKDCRRYVPGLYWITYFSSVYAKEMAINLPDIAARAAARLLSYETGTALQLYDLPEQWEARRNEVDDIIASIDNMFSMRRVNIPTGLRWQDASSPAAALSSLWP